MLDTVALNFGWVQPSIETLHYWNKTVETSGSKTWISYKYEVPNLPTSFILNYYPISKYINCPLLKIYVGSVPKLILGNNYQTVTDIIVINEKINEQLRKIEGLPLIDAGHGLLSRVDFCINYSVGAHVSDYLEVKGQLDFDHRNKSVFSNKRKLPFKLDKKSNGSVINGVLFSSSNVSTTFYDKQKECLSINAAGLLRHEARIRGKKALQQYTGLTNPQLKDLTPSIAEQILKKDLVRLGLDQEIFSEDSVNAQLIAKYGPSRGLKMSAFLCEITKHPNLKNKELAEKIGITYSTLCNWKKRLEKDGITLGLTAKSIELPQLIVSFDNKNINLIHKVLGDTKTDGDWIHDPDVLSGKRQPGDFLASYKPRCFNRKHQKKRGEWTDGVLIKSPS